jgi:hypothetical protein
MTMNLGSVWNRRCHSFYAGENTPIHSQLHKTWIQMQNSLFQMQIHCIGLLASLPDKAASHFGVSRSKGVRVDTTILISYFPENFNFFAKVQY